jgi:hypothetical protein
LKKLPIALGWLFLVQNNNYVLTNKFVNQTINKKDNMMTGITNVMLL